MAQQCMNQTNEYSIPSSIKSVEDTRPYARRCIEAMLDESKYNIFLEESKGVVYLSSIANDALVEMGFGEKVAGWVTHPFHWLFVCERKIAKMQTFKEIKKLGDMKIGGLWYLDKNETPLPSIDALTDEFMKKHGDVFYARISKMREDPKGYIN